jgi:hypothetical protein
VVIEVREFHTTKVSPGVSLEMIRDIQLKTITHKQEWQSMYDGTLRYFLLTIFAVEKQ